MLGNKCSVLSGSKNIKLVTYPFFYKMNCNFVYDLSKLLLRDIEAKKFPEIIKFAFWSRKSNLKSILKEYRKDHLRFGRGICLHILPRNTSINFAYSFVFGLLSGNSNIIRIPNRDNLVKIIISKINILLKKKKFKDIKSSNAIILYDKNSGVTEDISLKSDIRLIWGSDQTINEIKKIRTQPNCLDITFPDRFSLSVLNLEKINNTNLKNLIINFYNDALFMDQNACSSPHLVLWYSKSGKKIKQKKKLFWSMLSKHIFENYNTDEEIFYQKYIRYCENIINYKDKLKLTDFNYKNVFISGLKNLNFNISELRGLAGIFYEYDIKNIKDLEKVIDVKLQTINYFGFKKSNFISLLSKPLYKNGILRIVKVGQALDMTNIWDGYDIIESMSKIIELK